MTLTYNREYPDIKNNYKGSVTLNFLILFLLIIIPFFSHGEEQTDEVIIFTRDGKTVISGLSIVKENRNRAVVKVPSGKKIREFIRELSTNPDILYAVPNYRIKALLVPDDPLYQYQWYLKKINMEGAWDISTGSQTVYVAVIDSGVDYNHPDVKNNLWINQGETTGTDNNANGLDDGCEDGTDNDGNGYIDDCYGFNAVTGRGSALDDFGHGTHVAGIIGAQGNNTTGIAGINWDVKIIPCKFLDSRGNGELNDLLTCLNYLKDIEVDKGIQIHVINGSYGYTGFPEDLTVDCNTQPGTEKCLIQSFNGVFVAAAGNGGIDFTGDSNDNQVFLPCNYSTVNSNTICVGATDQADNKSSYSNYGFKTVNIFAPGGSAQTPQEQYQILSLYEYTNDGNPDNDYAYQIGTSQAAPVVAGIIALLKGSEPSLTVSQLINRVLSTGDNLLSLTGYSQTCNRVNGFNALTGEVSPKICLDKHISVDNLGYYYDFGAINPGTTKSVTFTIKSSGSGSLNIGGIQLTSNSVFKITDDSCSGKSLAFGEECTFTVSAYSTGTGNVSDTLSIQTNTDHGTIDIQLRGVLNNIPLINSFTAQPSSGSPPLNVRFTFSVSDVEGDLMTCYLDVNGDGNNDYTITGCNGVEDISHTYTSAGSYTAVLSVTDSAGGKNSSSVTVSVSSSTGGGGCSFDRNGNLALLPFLAAFIFIILLRHIRKVPLQF